MESGGIVRLQKEEAMAQRKQFPAAQKVKVAIEAIKSEKNIKEIASTYQVHPDQG